MIVDTAEAMAIPVDPLGLPPLDPELLAQLTPMTTEELGATFDELTEIAASQPEDVLALSGLRSIVAEVQGRGDILLAMEMAMTLGAMACTHSHMEGLANEVSTELGIMSGSEEQKPDASQEHDHCKTCKKHVCICKK